MKRLRVDATVMHCMLIFHRLSYSWYLIFSIRVLDHLRGSKKRFQAAKENVQPAVCVQMRCELWVQERSQGRYRARMEVRVCEIERANLQAIINLPVFLNL